MTPRRGTEKLTNGTGDVVATYKYDVFGAVRSSTGGSTEYKFTGQQADADAGYYYLRARYYDPGTGRFLTKDPFPSTPIEPMSYNQYIYVSGDPTNLVDPLGLFWPLDEVDEAKKRVVKPVKRFVTQTVPSGARAAWGTVSNGGREAWGAVESAAETAYDVATDPIVWLDVIGMASNAWAPLLMSDIPP